MTAQPTARSPEHLLTWETFSVLPYLPRVPRFKTSALFFPRSEY